ncbi:hypothetical protein [Glacieibacterium sp.]|uniref:hypothetical protein n=1 Tax=Glacieibacterium sp. TaxID=2860237 RepID=UPI003B005A0D
MSKLLRNMLFASAAGAALAACGGGDQATPTTPVVTTPAAKLEDSFGANFGVAYRADPNSVAKDPQPGDIIPLSLTATPVTI